MRGLVGLYDLSAGGLELTQGVGEGLQDRVTGERAEVDATPDLERSLRMNDRRAELELDGLVLGRGRLGGAEEARELRLCALCPEGGEGAPQLVLACALGGVRVDGDVGRALERVADEAWEAAGPDLDEGPDAV